MFFLFKYLNLRDLFISEHESPISFSFDWFFREMSGHIGVLSGRDQEKFELKEKRL